MQILIPFKTPSINHLYGKNGFRQYLTKEARELRREIDQICSDLMPESLQNTKLEVSVEIHENWFTLEDEVKRVDIANREKFLIDSIFESLKLDDKFIFVHTMKKIQNNDEEFALIEITPLNLQDSGQKALPIQPLQEHQF